MLICKARTLLTNVFRPRQRNHRRRRQDLDVQALESRCLLTATIQGRVWEDSNVDQTIDADEPFLDGKQVDLLTLDGRLVASMTTESVDLDNSGGIDVATESGWYRFEGFDPGHYQVQVHGVSADGQSLPATTSKIYGLNFKGRPAFHSPSGSVFFLNSSGMLHQVHAQSGTQIDRIELGTNYREITMSPNQQTLAAVGVDRGTNEILVQLIDLETSRPQTFRTTAKGYEWSASNASWLKDGSIFLITSGGPSHVSQSLLSFNREESSFQRVVNFSDDYRTLTSFDGGRVLIYPVANESQVARLYDVDSQTLSVVPSGTFDVHSPPLAFNRDGSLILRDGGRQSVLDEDFNVILQLEAGAALGFSPVDGSLVGYSNGDGGLQRIDALTGQPIEALGRHSETLRTPFVSMLAGVELAMGYRPGGTEVEMFANGRALAASILVHAQDDESQVVNPIGLKVPSPQILDAPTQIELTEGDEGVSVAVNLRQKPGSDVVVRTYAGKWEDFRVVPETLTFSPENWNVAQTFHVHAVDDDVPEVPAGSVFQVSVDPEFSDSAFHLATTQSIEIHIRDNDLVISGQVTSEAVNGYEAVNGIWMDLLSYNGELLQSTTSQTYDRNHDGQIDPKTENGIYQFQVNKPGRYFVSQRGAEKSVRYYDVQADHSATLYPQDSISGETVFAPDKPIAYVNFAGQIHRVNTDLAGRTTRAKTGHHALDFGRNAYGMKGLAMSDDGRYLFTGDRLISSHLIVYRYDLETDQVTKLYFKTNARGLSIDDMTLIDGGQLLITLTSPRDRFQWSQTGAEQVVVVDLQTSDSAVRVLPELSNVRLVRSGPRCHRVALSAVIEGEERPVLYDSGSNQIVSMGPTGMRAAAISLDGRFLVASNALGETILFDDDFRELLNLGAAFGGVGFLKDSNALLVNDSIENQIRVLKLDTLTWDTQLSQPVDFPPGHQRWQLKSDGNVLFVDNVGSQVLSLVAKDLRPDNKLVSVTLESGSAEVDFVRELPKVRLLGNEQVAFSVTEGQRSSKLEFVLNVAPDTDMFVDVVVPVDASLEPSVQRLFFSKENWFEPQRLTFFAPDNDDVGRATEVHHLSFVIGKVLQNGEPDIVGQIGRAIRIVDDEVRIDGRFWIDLDGNGRFDRLEQPVIGATVQLLNRDGRVISTTLSGSAQAPSAADSGWQLLGGHYQFNKPLSGLYSVRVVSEDEAHHDLLNFSTPFEVTGDQAQYSVNIGLAGNRSISEDILLSTRFVGLTRDASSGQVQVSLGRQPTAPITVTLEREGAAEIRADVHELTFSPDDWNAPQTVTFTIRPSSEPGGMGRSNFIVKTIANDDDPSWATSVRSSVSVEARRFDFFRFINDDRTSGRNMEQAIQWEPVTRAVAYEVQVVHLSEAPKIIHKQRLWSDKQSLKLPLINGKYRLWGRAHFDDGSVSDWTTHLLVKRLPPEPKPLSVDRLQDRLTASWEPVAGALKYRVYVNNTGYFDSPILFDEYVTATEVTYSGIEQPGTVNVWVQAIGEQGFRSHWSEVQRYSYVPAPIRSNAAYVAPTTTLRWTPVKGAVTYEVWFQNASGSDVSITSDVTGESFTFPEPLTAGKYTWWVRAFTERDTRGAWSVPTHIEVSPRTSIDVRDLLDGDSTLLLTWPTVEFAQSYDLYLRSKDQARIIQYKGIRLTQFQTAVIEPGDYEIWVRTVDQNGVGLWGESRHITVSPACADLPLTELRSPAFAVGRQPKLEWMAHHNAESFDVILMNGNDVRLVKQLSSSVYIPNEELSAGIWNWAVRAVDSRNRPGQWVHGPPIDTDGRVNVDMPATFVRGSAIEFHWAAPAAAVRFHLQVDHLTTETRRVIRIDDLTKNSFTADENLPSGQYRVWVRAIMPDDAFAPWSRSVDFEIR